MLRKFKEYVELHSKDPKNFEKKVVFKGTQKCPEFFKESLDFDYSGEKFPVIEWNIKSNVVTNENLSKKLKSFPSIKKVYDDFSGEEFLPNSTSDRSEIKKMKFPILGISEKDACEFKTYNSFKKSEKTFPVFREKIVPVTRFDVIAHKNKPIHLQEKIRSIGFDSNMNRFKYSDQVNHIIEQLNEKYNLDFYHISLIESGGKLYLEDIGTSLNLSPSQSIKMYESAYESFYETQLPVWFKKQLFETHVIPYYKKRYYDAALIKPKHSIDFKKFLD